MSNIYSSKRVLPYVYKCVERETGKFYIGYRFKNFLPSSEDFGKKYFTSNEYVKQNFKNFDHYIIAEFFDKKDAFAFETQLIKETKSIKQINCNKYNKLKKPYKKFDESKILPKKCALDGCDKIVKDWRKKCCSKSHTGIYSARKKKLSSSF